MLEAQYQDAARRSIDNLYTAYVDVLAARQNVRYAEVFGPSVNGPAVGVPAHPNSAGAAAQFRAVLAQFNAGA